MHRWNATLHHLLIEYFFPKQLSTEIRCPLALCYDSHDPLECRDSIKLFHVFVPVTSPRPSASGTRSCISLFRVVFFLCALQTLCNSLNEVSKMFAITPLTKFHPKQKNTKRNTKASKEARHLQIDHYARKGLCDASVGSFAVLHCQHSNTGFNPTKLVGQGCSVSSAVVVSVVMVERFTISRHASAT